MSHFACHTCCTLTAYFGSLLRRSQVKWVVILAYSSVEMMETDSTRNVGRSDLPSELGAVLAARETDPTPVVTRSGEVSRAESTSDMVTRSRAREGRGTNVAPEVEFRPETETRQELQEVNNPAEIQVPMSAICEGGLGPSRSYISDTASQYVTADRPETTAAFSASHEVVTESNPNYVLDT